MNLNALQTFGGPRVQLAAAKVAKISPQLLTGAGIVGGVTAAVMAARATLKLQAIIDDFEQGKEVIALNKANGEYADQRAYTKDVTYLYTTISLRLAKLYGPSAGLAAASITAIIGGQVISAKRQVALVAAVKGLESALEAYRARVIEEFGIDKDEEFRLGLRTEKITDEETGKTRTVKTVDPNLSGDYIKWFDDSNPNWEKSDPEQNLFFLKNMQNWMNNRLHARGFLFLNEVFEALGIEKTQTGQVVGWWMGNEHEKSAGDLYVDFGYLNKYNDNARKFINGDTDAILLDFNVDGVILDKI